MAVPLSMLVALVKSNRAIAYVPCDFADNFLSAGRLNCIRGVDDEWDDAEPLAIPVGTCCGVAAAFS
jgi:hypothetical protein